MRKYLILPLLALLVACQTLPQPRTQDQLLAAVYGTYTAVTNTVADLAIAGTISRDDALKAQEVLKQSRSVLDMAQATLAGGNPLSGDTVQKLQAVQSMLLKLQQQLQEKQDGNR